MNLESWELYQRNNETSEEFTESQLMRKFAMENNRISDGDVVTDSIGVIKVNFIGVTVAFEGYPCCLYHGVELNVKGGYKKTYRTIFQNDVINNNNG